MRPTLSVVADRRSGPGTARHASTHRFVDLLLRNNASYVPTLWVYPVPEAMQNLATVSQAGVRVAVGSDSFAPTIKIEGFDSGNFGANSATSQAAVHLQRDDIGAIGEGKRADMVLFQKDPTETVRNWKNPLAVISRGRLVVNRTQA
jgi:cytosine/adenosine deaminase-related metal-dependent hydrolase